MILTEVKNREVTIDLEEYRFLYENKVKVDLLKEFYEKNGYVGKGTMKILFDAEYKEEQED